nr:MAG TPA: Minor capsid protein [Caudoviricetes sp.]
MSIILKNKPLKVIYKGLGLEEKGKVQAFLDKTTAEYLMKYVSKKGGVQEKSIPTASKYGSGRIIINVRYARFQAEGKVMVGVNSRRAWARKNEKKAVINKNLKYHSDSLRGAHPFERMKADKKDSILNQTANFARRLS